jgi:hypothetical protein
LESYEDESSLRNTANSSGLKAPPGEQRGWGGGGQGVGYTVSQQRIKFSNRYKKKHGEGWQNFSEKKNFQKKVG